MGILRLLPLLALASCFDPDLDGLYGCQADVDCPNDLVCASDGLCRHDRAVSAVSAVDLGADLARLSGPPRDMSSADLSASPDLSTPLDLSMPDLASTDLACKPLKCMPGDCGDLDNGCGGVLHCKKCEG